MDVAGLCHGSEKGQPESTCSTGTHSLAWINSISRYRETLLNFSLCFFFLCCTDDKREAASKTVFGFRPARQSVRREVRQRSATARGRRKGAASDRPKHRRQELQQKEHLQPTQVTPLRPHHYLGGRSTNSLLSQSTFRITLMKKHRCWIIFICFRK